MLKMKTFPSSTVEQDTPLGTGIDIANAVCMDIQLRAELGRKRYGERLKSFNGRSSLIDAYQEALDLCMYLRQALEEQGYD